MPTETPFKKPSAEEEAKVQKDLEIEKQRLAEKEKKGEVPPPTSSDPTAMIQALQDRLDKMQKQNDMLLAVADKSRLAKWNSEHADYSLNKCFVSTYQGKLVVAWQNIKDEVGRNPMTGIPYETQIMRVMFEDGTHVEMPYRSFKDLEKVEASIVAKKTSTDANGTILVFTVDIAGKKVDMNASYLN